MRAPLALICFAFLSACVYRQDILQGNILKNDEVAEIKEGMTREQVQFILGTPMIADPFHTDRWDYMLYVDSQFDERDIYRRVTVWFENNAVVRIEKIGIEEVKDDTVPRAGFEETAEESSTKE